MRKLVLCFIILSCSAAAVLAQPAKINANKYRLNLPSYWKPGNKVWQILTDKLPEVCEELKDKELCGDNCNPKYTLEFYMSAPYIHDYYPNHISSDNNPNRPTEVWDFVTYYSFQCYLLLFDNKNNKLLTKVVITDTGDVWQVKTRATLLSFAPPSPYRFGLRSIGANSQAPQGYNLNSNVPVSQVGQTPYSFINSNKEKLLPAEKDMLAVVDDKIRSLKQ